MFGTRLLARLVMPVLVVTTSESLAAGEPADTTPPATSIREWRTAATPGSLEAATPPATSIREWRTTATPESLAADPPPAKSIREWRTTTVAAPATNPCSMQSVGPEAKPSVRAAASKSPMTISITSTLRQGNLVVMLDGVPIFNEKFQKPLLIISQTTTWDPVQIPAGQHKLSAKVYGTKKTYLSALYDLNVSRTKASALRFVVRGDRVTVEVAS